MQTVYFHGLPGGAADLDIADWASARRPRVMSPPDESLDITGDNSVHIIAFSGGAHPALTLAARNPDTVTKVSLIAPVAPLEIKDWSNASLSGDLLYLAKSDPDAAHGAFTGLIEAAKVDPAALLDDLFAGASAGEVALKDDPKLRQHFVTMITDGLVSNGAAIRDAFIAMAQPWAGILPQVTVPVEIHVGTADRRCPPDMSDAIADRVSGPVTVHRLPELGHYGALRSFAATV